MKKIKKILLLNLMIFFLISNFNAAYAGKKYGDSSYKDNEILISFKKNKKPSSLKLFASSYGLEYSLENNSVRKGKYYLFFSDNSDIVNTVKKLGKDSKISNAQPNYIFKTTGKVRKTKKRKIKPKTFKSGQDTYFDLQWWAYNDGRLGGIAGSDLYLISAWNLEQPNWADVGVGIIDSGLNPKHKDLYGNILNGYDFVHRNKDIEDREGHGSFLAGLIASRVNNRVGIAGLSQQNHLKIMPLKFDFSTFEAIQAILFAKEKGIRIINMSWGTNEFDQGLFEAIRDYNGLVFAAAGNDAKKHDDSNHFYPCDFDLENVICVGASSENDEIASYSDFGADYVDLLAPGGNDLSLISLDVKKDKYISGIGTSFATALVSGAAGMVLSANPSISNAQIKNSILANVRKKDNLEDKVSSSGILNILDSVKRTSSLEN